MDHKNDDVGYRGEEYKVVKGHKAGETNVEATYEYTSGNQTAKKSKREK
jgi:hypothetical protein